MKENAFLYFFSTYAQAVAALVGLSAAFGIYYYQNIRNYYIAKCEHLYHFMLTDPFKSLLNNEQRDKARDLVNHEQRALYFEPIFTSLSDDTTGAVLGSLGHRKIEFDSLKDEWQDWNKSKKQMKDFRVSFLFSSLTGLILVTACLYTISLAESDFVTKHAEENYRYFLLGLIFYLGTLLQTLNKALQLPIEHVKL